MKGQEGKDEWMRGSAEVRKGEANRKEQMRKEAGEAEKDMCLKRRKLPCLAGNTKKRNQREFHSTLVYE